jgi:hypothetical protein
VSTIASRASTTATTASSASDAALPPSRTLARERADPHGARRGHTAIMHRRDPGRAMLPP